MFYAVYFMLVLRLSRPIHRPRLLRKSKVITSSRMQKRFVIVSPWWYYLAFRAQMYNVMSNSHCRTRRDICRIGWAVWSRHNRLRQTCWRESWSGIWSASGTTTGFDVLIDLPRPVCKNQFILHTTEKIKYPLIVHGTANRYGHWRI